MTEQDPEQFDAFARRIAAVLVETRSERTDWNRWIQFSLGIAAGVSLIFSLGIN